MPENRFGGVNQQPLYSATGRMERGEAPQQSKFQSPTAGVQKDFGASNMPNNAQGTQGGFGANLMQSTQSYNAGPISIYGRQNGGGGGRRGRRSGGGGGDGDGSTDSSIHIDFGSNNTAFGADSGPKVDNRGIGGNNKDSANNYEGGPPAASGAATAQAANEGTNPAGEKRKRIVTDEQKARRKDTDQKNKSGERTPVPRGPRTKPAAVAPAAASTTTTTNTNNSTNQQNVVDNKSYVGPTTTIGRSGQPAAAQGAGQPGNAPFTIGGVKGASDSGPASIGATKVGKK